MRYFIILCLAFVFPVNSGATVQGQQPGEKLRCVVIPADYALLAIASQPGSPLVFEDAKWLRCTVRYGVSSYRLRNRGTKPIRSYTIAGWSSVGTGFKSSWGASTPEELIMPGQLAPVKEEELEMMPLTKEVREKLKLSGPMQGVEILMVVSVEFADGTSYNDEAASKALENYFENVGAKVH